MTSSQTQMIIGIFLLIAGVSVSIGGIVLIRRSFHIDNQPTQSEISLQLKAGSLNTTEFNNLISMATADGQLTSNEKSMLKEKASKLGLEYSDYEGKINEQLAANQHKKETQIIDKDKEKGNDFEKFVVKKFNQQYFSVLEWTGDKFVDGRYAKTSTNPDLKMQFKLGNKVAAFAVECKYRSNFYNDKLDWAEEYQIANYRKYETTNNIKVFVAIGVGGVASAPEQVYVIPLSAIPSTTLEKSFLQNYEKPKPQEKDFYYDYDKGTLK